jgi:hypothetical protein
VQLYGFVFVVVIADKAINQKFKKILKSPCANTQTSTKMNSG